MKNIKRIAAYSFSREMIRVYRWISFLVFVTIAASCTKTLEIEPYDAVSDEQTIVDKGSAENAVRGAYRTLANARYYGASFQTAVLMSGNVLTYTQSGTGQLQFQQHTLTADNNEVAAIWAGIYKTINIANHVITKLPGVNDYTLTAAYKNQLLGEAYFIRALSYFDLARTWGGVQIFLTPTVTIKERQGVKRSSLEEVYNQVLSDLNTAESLLPATTVRNRATVKTVRALRARLYLYTQKWSQAENDATSIIADSANYKLVKPYNTFFTRPNTTESVFELSFSAAFPNSLYSAFRAGGNYYANDSVKAKLTNPALGGTRSTLLNTNGTRPLVALYPASNGSDPTYLIRTAELWLIRAEARAQQNNLTGAVADLNAVRKRSDLAAVDPAGKDAVLLAIENERSLEFAFEPHRWYDLVRTGRADEVLGVTDTDRFVWPVPAPDRLADPALDQNKGY
jgi:starch-binding outer membrane protein, SusD/RagB family